MELRDLLRPDIPVLIELLQDEDRGIQFDTASTLARLAHHGGLQLEAVVRTLMDM